VVGAEHLEPYGRRSVVRVTTPAATHRRRARRGEGERLRAEILVAARELLAETQDADGVSIRAVADRVGVSTPSIYLHYTDKAALLEAVCEAVFADLDTVMEQAAATTDDPFESLRLRGLVYVRFALDNPEQYRLAMMRMPDSGGQGHPFTVDDIVAGAAYQHLTAAAQRCIDVGVFAPGTDPATVATTLWAATHGVVALCLAKPGMAGDDAVALCDRVITTVGLGIAAASHLDAGAPQPGTAGPYTSHEIAKLLGRLTPR
jgi:AcrR family transcriptional regulator